MAPTPPAVDAKDPPTERGWPLRTTVLAAVTFALLPIAGVSILQGVERAHLDFADVHERLSQSARAAASDEENLLASAEQIARALGSASDVRNMTADCSAALNDALIGVRYFANISRIDKTGHVACSGLPLAKGRYVGDMAIYKRALASRNFVVSGQIHSVVLNRPIIAGMLPLYDRNGNFEGVMSVALELHWLDFMVRAQNLPTGAVVFVYDREGHILASNDAGVASRLIGSARGRDGSEDLRTANDSAGSNWTYASAPLSRSALSVAFAMRESHLFWPTYLHVGTDFFMPILMIGLAWAGIWFATERQVTQWIAYLRRISAAYRRGHYAIRPQLEDAPREFRALGDGMSEMAEAIQDRDRKLREAVDQKSLLIREIHHRVKNNLQIVMSLLSLQAGQVRDPAARDALMQAQVRINALALVHRILHEIDDQTTIDLKRLLHELARQIAEGMRAEQMPIRIEENLLRREVPGDVAVPLALFAVEALTNIFKYAFPQRRAGVIAIALTPAEGGRLRLTIADNGVGFDEGAHPSGMGSRLIKTFGQQIGGESSLHSEPGKGTTVEVLFRDPAANSAPPNS